MLGKRLLQVVAGIVLAATSAACNLGKSPQPTPDVAGLYTAAADTLVAQLHDQQTQTAAAVPPTPAASPTPLASFTSLPTLPLIAGLTPFGTFTFGTPGVGLTPLPTLVSGTIVSGFAVGCNNAVFIGETIPDGTKMVPMHSFKKTWSLQNTGTCAWDEGYSFAFKSGERLGGFDVKITKSEDFTEPNHSQAFVIPMEAPKDAGEYKGYWQMKDDSGNWFGSLVSVDIIVEE
jgi:hypothetical protein